MQVFKRLSLLGVGLVFILPSLAQSKTLSAADILQQMKRVYASTKSYVDRGTVSSVFIDKGKKRVVEKPFSTAFVRPDRFRYEFREKKGFFKEDDKFVISLIGKGLKTYWSLDPEQQQIKPKTLGEALSAAAGISGGSARWVPTMLMPDRTQFKNAFTLSKPKRVNNEVVNGVECFQLSDPTDYRRLTLWIGKKDYLLRKIYREQDFGDFRLEETTNYNPETDGEVKQELLNFQ
ncbi:hypothetical protein SAMN02745165_03515 [Malonomonas rubra DSM 5091]|uniref:Outer membrane lipoprotein-sorting protein n=1 Tax=Malonomonas rubra DSM 5091 TaxID=1122189 RepID=A0A1M6N6M0_MALRU|nr:DUF2092 domain-containing protein [Malonomonas rubra]SHJ91206.1 hypothetical protein SAMN02745165_03515 [Malonomonas rubra DSM 5091]